MTDLGKRLYDLAPSLGKYRRLCAVCTAPLTPFSPETLTAHEFGCYKVSGKTPQHHAEAFAATLKWEKRSLAAKRGLQTRRRNKAST
jgi:hypothetical protein